MNEIARHDRIRRTLAQTLIGQPLADKLRNAGENELFDVIIDPNLDYAEGCDTARRSIAQSIGQAIRPGDPDPRLRPDPFSGIDPAHPYIFATLTARAIREIARSARIPAGSAEASGRVIYRIWDDTEIEPLITRSISTVKADAAQKAFAAEGEGIVWAVIDSGIDAGHPHFERNSNLSVPAPLLHRDFTGAVPEAPLTDGAGHGSHVAGIIAGICEGGEVPNALTHDRDEESGAMVSAVRPLAGAIRGMAPKTKLLSLKVLDAHGKGKASAVIEAIAAIRKFNAFGRRIVVHGVNLSAGYPFMPEWFACGESPLCVEVNRLVRSGVVVVVAAGNSGYGSIGAASGPLASSGLPLTINDPGNAEDAITVGSTHRDMPHTYGVSYFSSKGPTGDGRLKPDLVAPGERILSCAAGDTRAQAAAGLPPDQSQIRFAYVEDSGTSMAAPHVSGAIAAFLSVRREFIGRPGEVKQLFMKNATDLKRDRAFQGSGLVDLMRVIQAV